jgi:hypothetical protein
VNRKVLSGLLVGMGMLALSTTAAQASGGGFPSALTSFFVCRAISGDDAGLSVDVDSTDPAGLSFKLKNVRIGNATLACAFAKLFQPGTTTAIEPNPSALFNQLKCYSISIGRGQAGTPPPNYSATDQLVTDPTVNSSSVQFICAPAQFIQQ